MNDNDDLNSDDIDMLTSNGISPAKQIGYENNSDGNANSPNGNSKDSFDDSFMTESDTRTPGEILDEFCMKLEDINTTLPDSVINHYMKKAGFIVNDPKLIKIVSIASQKFISEIVNDVMQHHKLKTKNASVVPTASASQTASAKNKTGAGASGGSAAAVGTSSAQGSSGSGALANGTAPLTLTLEDLSQVLTEYGINVKKPYYFM